MGPPRVALVGVGGYGAWHLAAIGARHRRGELRCVGLCDVREPTGAERDLIGSVPAYRRIGTMLAEQRPRVTVIATPPATHAALATEALRAGSDVLLEKPPVIGVRQFDALRAVESATGQRVQVGFQSLGSHALPALVQLVRDGQLGTIEGIGAAGTWIRTSAYYTRASWAGRRFLDGQPVLDGCLTNPFAHAVLTAFAVAAPGRTDLPATAVQVQLYRANDIEADDTGCLRARLPDAPPVLVAATLCAEREREPVVVVRGSAGRAVLHYRCDELVVERDAAPGWQRRYDRTDLLDNLLAHRGGAAELLVPLAATRSFMDVLEAVRHAVPLAVPEWAVRRRAEGPAAHREIEGIDDAVYRAAHTGRLLSELDLPWTAVSCA